MLFKHRLYHDVLRLECLSDITLKNANLFKLAVIFLAHEGVATVEMDLRQVDLIDGSGLCALISCRRNLREMNIRLILIHPSDKVKLLFGLTRTEPLFELRDPNLSEWTAGQHLEALSRFNSPSLAPFAI